MSSHTSLLTGRTLTFRCSLMDTTTSTKDSACLEPTTGPASSTHLSDTENPSLPLSTLADSLLELTLPYVQDHLEACLEECSNAEDPTCVGLVDVLRHQCDVATAAIDGRNDVEGVMLLGLAAHVLALECAVSTIAHKLDMMSADADE